MGRGPRRTGSRRHVVTRGPLGHHPDVQDQFPPSRPRVSSSLTRGASTLGVGSLRRRDRTLVPFPDVLGTSSVGVGGNPYRRH